MPSSPSPNTQSSRPRKVFLTLVLASTSILVALLLAEVLLRMVPIPGIAYHSYYYNRVTGGRYYPNTTNIYRNARNDYVRRKINSWGFMDYEHTVAKAPGVVRIGFFGDSYTEAQQVPIDDTFVQVISRSLNRGSGDGPAGGAANIECVSFGITGYSTLQSYLECRTWMRRLDLDWVVYVFVENDPGDQIRNIKRSPGIPYAVASGDSFVVDFSFRERFAYKDQQPHRTFQYIKSHSLVLSTIVGRLKLLKKRGVKIRATPDDMAMAERGDKKQRPTSATPPSAWPDTLLAYTAKVGGSVLDAWANEVRTAGKRFAVLYMPRARELGKPYETQDSWAAWLAGRCAAGGIDLVDPSPQLLDAAAHGEEIFYDHLTPDGHRALGEAFVDYFQQR